jgi:hypothetical protein
MLPSPKKIIQCPRCLDVLSERGFNLHNCYSRIDEKEKQKARKKVEKAVLYGRLIKPTSCSWCKEADHVIHGHHDDYSKPLEVEWLCQPCHQELHNYYNKVYFVRPSHTIETD